MHDSLAKVPTLFKPKVRIWLSQYRKSTWNWPANKNKKKTITHNSYSMLNSTRTEFCCKSSATNSFTGAVLHAVEWGNGGYSLQMNTIYLDAPLATLNTVRNASTPNLKKKKKLVLLQCFTFAPYNQTLYVLFYFITAVIKYLYKTHWRQITFYCKILWFSLFRFIFHRRPFC